MKEIGLEEQARQLAEEAREASAGHLQKFILEGPQIIEDMRRAAARQWEETEKISASAREMLQVAQQILHKALEQMGKA